MDNVDIYIGRVWGLILKNGLKRGEIIKTPDDKLIESYLYNEEGGITVMVKAPVSKIEMSLVF